MLSSALRHNACPSDPCTLLCFDCIRRAERHRVPTFRGRFLKMALGAPSGVDVDALKSENEALKERVKELEQKCADAEAAAAPAEGA